MSREDIVLIAGDFGGIWEQTEPHPLRNERDRIKALKNEETTLDWFAKKNPTFCFVLGNHENWNRYDGDEFPVVDFYGGKAHKLRDNVYHLMNGYVFDFDGYKVYVFGGAASHDIVEGIFDPASFTSVDAMRSEYRKWKKTKYLYRVKNLSWWERESKPTDEEIARGWKNLEANDNRVNLILTHCFPSSVAAVMSHGTYKPDDVTRYLEMVNQTVKFDNWICGHYHDNTTIMSKYHVLYEQIVPVRIPKTQEDTAENKTEETEDTR